MIFSLLVLNSPYGYQSSLSALQFAKALLAKQHRLYRVFFYSDGVYQGNRLATPMQDEPQLLDAWQQLAKDHQVDMVICVASALKRGIINPEEARRYGHTQHNMAEGMEISGLGQLIDAAVQSDRLITFGR